MNTRGSIVQRDWAKASVITLAALTLLFIRPVSRQPGFAPMRLAPPIITYCPALLTAGTGQEHYDEWNATHSPTLISLSAAMMLPAVKRSQADTVTPPLDTATGVIRFPDTPPTKRRDQTFMLTPPRPMNSLTAQHIVPAVSVQHQSSTPPVYQMELTGNWQDRSVDIAPLLTLSEPSAPWSFTVVLRYDDTGRVQNALLETAALEAPLRDEITRRLYQCRVTPSGRSGEGRLTLSGPGRASRP